MDEHGPGLHRANPDAEWVPRAAIIRFPPATLLPGGGFAPGDGPYIHRNAQHIAVGVIDVRVEPDGDLYIDVDGGPISFIGALSDETLIVRGIQFGPSGTAAASTLRCYKDGVGRLNLNTQAGWNAVAGDLSNIWCKWDTCIYPGIGLPSKADRALTHAAALQDLVDEQAAQIAGQAATLADLAGRVDLLEQGGGS